MCWFVYVKENANTTGSISTELGGRIGNRPKKSPLNFDVGLDQGMDPEFLAALLKLQYGTFLGPYCY